MSDTNDKELLEIAAKAVGVDAQWDCPERGMMVLDKDGTDTVTWNPLTDDGDALRLAVKLELDVMCASVCSFDYAITVTIEAGTEPYAATRRAITRAAAAIGKNML